MLIAEILAVAQTGKFFSHRALNSPLPRLLDDSMPGTMRRAGFRRELVEERERRCTRRCPITLLNTLNESAPKGWHRPTYHIECCTFLFAAETA